MTKVTQRHAEHALTAVAQWLATKGYGTPVCQHGRELDYCLRHADDATTCERVTFDPAPTGREAHRNGEGPELVMDWDWSGTPTPTILFEGGPDDWALNCAGYVSRKVPSIWAEPYAGYALSLYPVI